MPELELELELETKLWKDTSWLPTVQGIEQARVMVMAQGIHNSLTPVVEQALVLDIQKLMVLHRAGSHNSWTSAEG